MRVRRVVAVGLCALVLGACTGGGSHPASSTGSPSGSETTTSTKPGGAAASEAQSAIAAYDSAIAKALPAGDGAALRRAQSGGVLARTLADLRVATHQHKPAEVPDALESPVTYPGSAGTSPAWFLVRQTNQHDPGQTQFSLLLRSGSGWRVSFESVAQGHALPEPVLTEGALTPASAAQTTQARTAVAWVCGYLNTTKRPAGLTDVALAQQNAEIGQNYREQNNYFETASSRCRIDPKSTLRVIQTSDGAVEAFASLVRDVTDTARKGYALRLDPYDGAFTSHLRHVLRVVYRESEDVVVRVAPDGTAALIGYTEGLVAVSAK